MASTSDDIADAVEDMHITESELSKNLDWWVHLGSARIRAEVRMFAAKSKAARLAAFVRAENTIYGDKFAALNEDQRHCYRVLKALQEGPCAALTLAMIGRELCTITGFRYAPGQYITSHAFFLDVVMSPALTREKMYQTCDKLNLLFVYPFPDHLDEKLNPFLE